MARSNGRSPGSPATASSAPTATPSRPAEGGTHEAGLRTALTAGFKAYAELTGNKRAAVITADDVMTSAAAHALGLHPRAGIRRPDQGPAVERRGDAHRRERRARPLRPLARRLAHRGDAAPRLGDRARRGAAAPPAGEGDRPQDRDAQAAPARQARRLQRRAPARAPRSSSSRATRPAAPPSRRANRAHPGDPAAARQDPQRRQRRPREARRRTSSSPTSCRRSASRHRRALPRGRPPLRPRHHHDRRRRRRRPHRLAAHHLLLSRDAGADPRGPPLPRRAAALPPDARAPRSLYARDDAHRERAAQDASSRATARSRSAASRASAR